MNRIRRSKAKEDKDITAFIFYIHKNAVHHGLTTQIGDWQYDSYNTIISNLPTDLDRDFVIEWFGSKESFIKFHNQPVDLKNTIID